MLRRSNYRTAGHLFLFLGLWFVVGAVVLRSPVPGALGIGDHMFSAWVVLFFLIMAVAGASLFMAALNDRQPPSHRTPAMRSTAQRASQRPDAAPSHERARQRG